MNGYNNYMTDSSDNAQRLSTLTAVSNHGLRQVETAL